MGNESGEWIMHGMKWDNPECIRGIGVQVQEERIMLLQIGGGLENKEESQCHLRLSETI